MRDRIDGLWDLKSKIWPRSAVDKSNLNGSPVSSQPESVHEVTEQRQAVAVAVQ